MPITSLDHVNIRTANMDELSRFYEEILGLKRGDRPPFDMDGAWHYCGEAAVVHLVRLEEAPDQGEPQVEHFAFFATGLADFLDHLRGRGISYDVAIVPEVGNKQVNIHDPDGNHIEIQFDAGEEADTSPFQAT
ncbi:MAG: VOC family protein [Alphaproteobacteria bacterium]